MAEKIKDESKKINLKDVVIILLLIVICALLICQHRKMNRLVNWKTEHIARMERIMSNEKMRIKGPRLAKDFEKGKGEVERDYRNMKDRTREAINNEKSKYENENVSISTKESFDVKNNLFIVEMDIPRNIEKDDIKIDFNDNMLAVDIYKVNQVQENNANVIKFVEFSRIFNTPSTKATLDNIKHVLDNGKLTVTVPIVK